MTLETPSLAQSIRPALIQPEDRIVPQDRIVDAINPASRISLLNSVYPFLASATSSTVVDPAFAMDHMILTLQPSPAQQAALTALATQQQDPNSANFHKFLTPAQFAASFGASTNDINKIAAWLKSSGFQIDELVASNLAVVFSGNALQVESAFDTEIRQYVVNGETHYANAMAIQIPAALRPVVTGLVKLNDFHAMPPSAGSFTSSKVVMQDSTTGAHHLVPADYAVIYDLKALYRNGFSGDAQSIAVVGRSNVNPADIASFRADYGLPANAITTFFATGTDPGITADDNTLESTLDVEWAGAIAPAANIKFVIAASTASTDGVDLAAQYAVNHNVASILSVSYENCEVSANDAFYNSLWQQAAVQGISVIVSAGDSGVAGCHSSASGTAKVRAVNGICSTPYNTCVGGTMFSPSANPGEFWLAGGNAMLGSAVRYIPEQAWNESALAGGTGLVAGGGGASGIYAKPDWQTGTGVPSDGYRDVPDVSLAAAQHDGYMIYYNGAAVTISGTSAAAPSLAGIMALVDQKAGTAQGNINPVLYALAARGTPSGTSAIFHDITSGNNSVPGLTGYSAHLGYDLVSGLGSVDAAQLVKNWPDVAGGFTLTASALSVSTAPGVNGAITLSLADLGTFNSAVTLTISTLPSGVSTNFAPVSISGGASSVLTFAASGASTAGTYPMTVTGNGGGFTGTASFSLVVAAAPTCTLSASPTSLTVTQSLAASTKLVCGSTQGNFASSLTLTVTGTPTGATAAFSPAATLTAGSGVTSLVINATSAATPGTYALLVTATGPNASPAFSTSISVPLTISAATTFIVTPSATAVSIPQGAAGTLTLTSHHSGAFNSAISFQTSGLPSTVSATLSASTIAAPGDGSLTITLQALTVATTGTYTMTVLAQGGGLVLRIPIAVQVTVAPAFKLTASTAVVTLRKPYVSGTGASTAGTSTVAFAIGTLTNNFDLPVTLSIGTLPAGVTAAFSPATLPAPGSGTSTLTLTASTTATTSVSIFTVTAVGGTITRSVNVELILTPPPSFSLSVTYPSYTLLAGAAMTQTVTATPLFGYNSNIQMTATAPTGISATLAPTTISGANGTSTITIQPAVTLVAGTYAITVSGTDPLTGNVETAQISLVVASVVTTLSGPSVSLAPGGSTTATITTVATSYTGSVFLSLVGLPAGVSYALSQTSIAGGSGSSTLTLLAGNNAPNGSYPVTIKSSAAGIIFTTTFMLTIT